jgi:hypothetical protein
MPRAVVPEIEQIVQFIDCDTAVQELCGRWSERLDLAGERLQITTSRRRFELWLGRRVDARIGGAYAFVPGTKTHIVLINLPRIDTAQPKAVELVVCEELLHMRHRLDGDHRRHAKHGYDRIAHQVATLTDSTLDEVRSVLIPQSKRPYRYRYECPTCRTSILRRKRGVWSCSRCSPTFSRKHQFVLVEEFGPAGPSMEKGTA